jgi:hypothetical protein
MATGISAFCHLLLYLETFVLTMFKITTVLSHNYKIMACNIKWGFAFSWLEMNQKCECILWRTAIIYIGYLKLNLWNSSRAYEAIYVFCWLTMWFPHKFWLKSFMLGCMDMCVEQRILFKEFASHCQPSSVMTSQTFRGLMHSKGLADSYVADTFR